MSNGVQISKNQPDRNTLVQKSPVDHSNKLQGKLASYVQDKSDLSHIQHRYYLMYMFFNHWCGNLQIHIYIVKPSVGFLAADSTDILFTPTPNVYCDYYLLINIENNAAIFSCMGPYLSCLTDTGRASRCRRTTMYSSNAPHDRRSFTHLFLVTFPLFCFTQAVRLAVVCTDGQLHLFEHFLNGWGP